MTMNARTRPLGGQLLRAIFGAVVGAATVGLFFRFAGPSLIFAGSGAIALSGAALIYLLMGCFVGLGTLAPQTGAKVLNVAGAEDLVDQRAELLAGSAVFLVLGCAFLMLVAAGPAGFVPDWAALSGLAAALLVSIWIGINQRRSQDEMHRLIAAESAEIALTMIVLSGIGWAALGHLGYAASFDPLWVIAALAVIGLLANFIAAGRRGLLTQDQSNSHR
jgi:hypothetical protein